ncbi:alanyl-tRNA editing protein [Achromobacter insuavis]|uniref:alanyl-tRNA editing protein n=1 Tax=Achromobacter insuavis TaxID=1287735 RepID=UPI003B9A1F2F
MATDKIFWKDSYLTRLDTTVAAVDGDDIRLDATIFFAFSGGQESDAGTIGGCPVLVASKAGLDIVYRLAPGHGLSAGDAVAVQIDWDRRYGLMRHHFAAEMVLQLVYRLEPGIEKVGAHIAPAKARIDFARAGNIADLFERLNAETDALVAAAKPIVTAFSDEATQRRYWEVEGFSRMGCGGTHPRTTREIGPLHLKRRNQGKGVERIEITLDAAGPSA